LNFIKKLHHEGTKFTKGFKNFSSDVLLGDLCAFVVIRLFNFGSWALKLHELNNEYNIKQFGSISSSFCIKKQGDFSAALVVAFSCQWLIQNPWCRSDQ